MKANNVSKSYVFLEVISTNTGVRNQVSARQQEPNLSNRLHAGPCAVAQTHHAREMQGHVRVFVHLTDCTELPLQTFRPQHNPRNTSTGIPPQQGCNSSLLFLYTSSYPAIHVANTDLPCHARRSSRQGDPACWNCSVHTSFKSHHGRAPFSKC